MKRRWEAIGYIIFINSLLSVLHLFGDASSLEELFLNEDAEKDGTRGQGESLEPPPKGRLEQPTPPRRLVWLGASLLLTSRSSRSHWLHHGLVQVTVQHDAHIDLFSAPFSVLFRVHVFCGWSVNCKHDNAASDSNAHRKLWFLCLLAVLQLG